MVEVRLLPFDGMRALRAVDGDGTGLIGMDEIHLVLIAGELVTCYLISHEVGKDFLHPEVVGPVHLYNVAKPEVGRFVGNQFHPLQLGFLRGVLLKEDTTVAQLEGTRVLHSTEGVVGQDGHTVLLEGRAHTRIALHPLERLADVVDNLVKL